MCYGSTIIKEHPMKFSMAHKEVESIIELRSKKQTEISAIIDLIAHVHYI